ncbi:serine protease [Blautia schinkii]|nr:serine protease [Blautia schinkii]
MEKYEGYSVLITDTKSRRGTGTLFYMEGDKHFYVFTCAHVIYGAKSVQIEMLVDVSGRDPEKFVVQVASNHFYYSPIDEVTVISEWQSKHTCDIAVIECEKGDIPLASSQYFVYPMTKREEIISVGYPYSEGNSSLYYQQTELLAGVEKVLEKENYFVIRVNSSFLNTSDRESELRGFSGSPVWDKNEADKGMYLFGGLIAFGEGSNIPRSQLNVMKARAIQSLMRDVFDIYIESCIPGVPKEDIAPGYISTADDTRDQKAVRDSWMENEKNRARTYVDNLKLQKCIEVCRETISNSEFEKCTIEQKYNIYAVLLMAYRLARDYESYDCVSDEMHSAGIRDSRENLYNAVRYFEDSDYDKAEVFIQMAIQAEPDGNVEHVVKLAIEVCRDVSAEVSLLSPVIGRNDQLLIEPKSPSEEESIYQMLGFIFAHRFRNMARAIRCLNRAYRISGNFIILETLATVYYFNSIRNAYIEEGSDRINPLKIDQSEIEKARDAYLRLMDTADDLYFRGMISRTGIQMYKCFYFMHDNFRIYRHYKDLIKYYRFHNQEEKRDIQRCYLEVAVLKEPVDLCAFDALTERDREFISLSTLVHSVLKLFGQGISAPVSITEKELHDVLKEAEKKLANLVGSQAQNQLYEGIRIALINLYGNGVLRFQWDALPQIRMHFSYIKNELAAESIGLYVDELERKDFTVSEKKYKQFFDKYQDVISFNEWCHFYTRNGRDDIVKELYDSVFKERNFLIKDQQEYFYREYIMFYMIHRYNLIVPIRCFVEHRNEIKDIFLQMFFETELNFSTTTFNSPDIMIDTVHELFDEGIIDEKECREKCLIINMLNCRLAEAEAYVDPSHERQIHLASKYELTFFAWKGIGVIPNPHWKAMQSYTSWKQFHANRSEKCVQSVVEVLSKYNYCSRKTIVVDLWGIYAIIKLGFLKIFNHFDKIYVTHYTVSRALYEISNVNDKDIHIILFNLRMARNVVLQSPTLEEQLQIRSENRTYTEADSTLLLAETLDCPALVGDFCSHIEQRFCERVIRLEQLEELYKYLEGV